MPDEVDWNPGKGTKGAFRLLGRRGYNLPGLRLADFRYQQGIYILYGNHGPYYVGLTKRQGLGKRLKDHLLDSHSENWDRFSWFGFRSVLKGKDVDGFYKLAPSGKCCNRKPEFCYHRCRSDSHQSDGFKKNQSEQFQSGGSMDSN